MTDSPTEAAPVFSCINACGKPAADKSFYCSAGCREEHIWFRNGRCANIFRLMLGMTGEALIKKLREPDADAD